MHRYCDFADTTYLDFVTSAAAIAPVLAVAPDHPVGATVLEAVQRTRLVAPANTNLGIALLLAPLAKAAGGDLRPDLLDVLNAVTVADAVDVYAAIRLANPGGLGRAADQDVAEEPTLTLREVMGLAADRDLIARQIAHGFREVLEVGVPAVRHGLDATGSLEGAIVVAQLRLMSDFPDSLIGRKLGRDVAEEGRTAGPGGSASGLAPHRQGMPAADRSRRLVACGRKSPQPRHDRRPGRRLSVRFAVRTDDPLAVLLALGV